MRYESKKVGLNTYHEAVIEGVDISDAEVLYGLKAYWAKIEETIGDLTDLDHLRVILAGEDGDIMVCGVAKSNDISLNRQDYRLIIRRMEYEWQQYDELDDDEFDVQAFQANVLYARLSEEARGDRFSSHDVRYYELNGEDELI